VASRKEVLERFADMFYRLNTGEGYCDYINEDEVAEDFLKYIEEHMVPISTKPVEDLYGNVRDITVYEWED